MNTKEVAGFQKYLVNTGGQVISRRLGRPLSPKTQKNGYLTVNLSGGGSKRMQYVHRLVLQTFVGPAGDGQEALHLDGVKSNNNLTNLKWGTHAENLRMRKWSGNSGPLRKLKPSDVADMRMQHSFGEKPSVIALDYPQVTLRTVLHICAGHTWKDT